MATLSLVLLGCGIAAAAVGIFKILRTPLRSSIPRQENDAVFHATVSKKHCKYKFLSFTYKSRFFVKIFDFFLTMRTMVVLLKSNVLRPYNKIVI